MKTNRVLKKEKPVKPPRAVHGRITGVQTDEVVMRRACEEGTAAYARALAEAGYVIRGAKVKDGECG